MTLHHEDRHRPTHPGARRPCFHGGRSSLSRRRRGLRRPGGRRQRRPAALFVHGVLVNADLWRNVIWDVADLRRCIAPDLPAHGATPVPADDDGRTSPCTGSPPCSTNCADASVSTRSTSWPTTPGRGGAGLRGPLSRAHPHADADQLRRPRQFPARAVQAVRRAWPSRASSGPWWPPWPETWSSPAPKSGSAWGTRTPDQLPDEILDELSSGPFVADQGEGSSAVLTASSASELMAVEPWLAQFRPPPRWRGGPATRSSRSRGRERLADMIPGVERVVLVPDAMLFWPDERAADLVPLLREFWAAHA